ncbi:MAG: hypothetical protein AVDCRST_MAG06-1665 [uncultured Nocardioides sp.]|uniref:Uncharacterized protein n=1 Tax=uncultured Nocardioides sp. TaxID=198441 RepID=A0A6J4NMB7_9ACTN|nr:MAG: hypothetical protein AVDCRST_MAG06-1665 [uncultured Nocardioides sp.]
MPTTIADDPSRAVPAGVAATMPSTPASVSAASLTAASPVPGGVSTRSTMPGAGLAPVAAWMRSTARTDSASGGAKPPSESSAPATGPPNAPATRTNRKTATRARRGWSWSLSTRRVVGEEVMARPSRHRAVRRVLPGAYPRRFGPPPYSRRCTTGQEGYRPP